MWRAPIPHLSLFDRKVEQGLIVFTAGRAFLKKIKHLVVGVSGKRALGKNCDRVVGGNGTDRTDVTYEVADRLIKVIQTWGIGG